MKTILFIWIFILGFLGNVLSQTTKDSVLQRIFDYDSSVAKAYEDIVSTIKKERLLKDITSVKICLAELINLRDSSKKIISCLNQERDSLKKIISKNYYRLSSFTETDFSKSDSNNKIFPDVILISRFERIQKFIQGEGGFSDLLEIEISVQSLKEMAEFLDLSQAAKERINALIEDAKEKSALIQVVIDSMKEDLKSSSNLREIIDEKLDTYPEVVQQRYLTRLKLLLGL